MPALCESLELLAATPEHERIATLEPHHAPARAGVLDELLVDPLLGRAAAARGLADTDSCRVASRHVEDALAHEAVVQDDVRVGKRPQRLQGQ